MTNDSNSGPKGAPEDDPLSATAMFFRTLDQQAASKQAEPAEKFDFGAGPASGIPAAPPSRPQSGSDHGEFTAIFGTGGSPAATPAPPSSQPKPAPSEDLPPTWQDPASASKQGQGEFTRIFVKGASAPSKPAGKSNDPVSEAAPPRAKGFSSPGVSDAASAQSGFSQFFKPVAKVDATPDQPVQPIAPPAFRPESPRPASTPDPFRIDSAFGAPPRESSSTAQDPQSITSLIQALSSQASSGAGSRGSETAPYRPESSPAPFQPVAKPPAPSEFESGGVTQFIQRLAEMPPAPVAEAPPALPIREQDSGQGEYTRIISRPTASSPAPPTASPAPPPAAPSMAPIVKPVMPVVPAVPAIPPTPVIASHPSPHQAAIPAMQAPVIPTPHLPPVPAPPAIAAPKGKLEALVPMLLVVNTFLLVVILVVMIFVIKAR